MNDNTKNLIAQHLAEVCTKATHAACNVVGNGYGDTVTLSVSAASGAIVGAVVTVFEDRDNIGTDEYLFTFLLAARCVELTSSTRHGAMVAISFEPSVIDETMADFEKLTGRNLWPKVHPELMKLVEDARKIKGDKSQFGRFILN